MPFLNEEEYIIGWEWEAIQINSYHIFNKSLSSIFYYYLNPYFKRLRSQIIPINQNVQDISQLWLKFASICAV